VKTPGDGWRGYRGDDGMLQAPKQIVDPKDRTIRFRVEDDAGLSSATWVVKGSKNGDDVYIGARAIMSEIKLSLHSGTWRMAYTAESTHAKTLGPDQDRLLTRWAVTSDDLTHGWRHALTITIPPSSLCKLPPDPSPSARTAVYLAPENGWGMRFDVLLGDPDEHRSGLTVVSAGNVGRLTLRTGRAVWVVATDVPVTAEYERQVELAREAARAHPTPDAIRRGWAWGSDPADGHPGIIDLGDLRRASA
jgi:hypothetical protein